MSLKRWEAGSSPPVFLDRQKRQSPSYSKGAVPSELGSGLSHTRRPHLKHDGVFLTDLQP